MQRIAIVHTKNGQSPFRSDPEVHPNVKNVGNEATTVKKDAEERKKPYFYPRPAEIMTGNGNKEQKQMNDRKRFVLPTNAPVTQEPFRLDKKLVEIPVHDTAPENLKHDDFTNEAHLPNCADLGPWLYFFPKPPKAKEVALFPEEKSEKDDSIAEMKVENHHHKYLKNFCSSSVSLQIRQGETQPEYIIVSLLQTIGEML